MLPTRHGATLRAGHDNIEHDSIGRRTRHHAYPAATWVGLRGAQIAEITSFIRPEHFPPFWLPASLS
jgi:hypothetical protein